MYLFVAHLIYTQSITNQKILCANAEFQVISRIQKCPIYQKIPKLKHHLDCVPLSLLLGGDAAVEVIDLGLFEFPVCGEIEQ